MLQACPLSAYSIRTIMLRTLLFASSLLVPPPPAVALPWIDSGHRIIALRCWAELAPPLRARLATMLQQHPRYREDLLAGLPADSDAAATAAHAFAQAAIWPDTVRSPGHPLHRAHHHSRWHYVNMPLVRDGVAVPDEPATGAGPHDVIGALLRVRAELADEALPAKDRAVALCWLLHLVADLHQPLHACTLYSEQFPRGDKGGNEFFVMKDVRYENTKMNLHLLWDSLLGSYESVAFDSLVANGLALRPGNARAAMRGALGPFAPAEWARESHALAVEHAYLRGTLKGLPEKVANQQKGAPPVPADYMANAEQVAMRQALRAAYRLADAIEAAMPAR